MRQVLPWSCIKSIALEGTRITIRAQEVAEKKSLSGAALKELRYDLAFEEQLAAETALSQLNAVYKNKQPESTSERREETFFDAHLRTHPLHRNIVDQRIVMVKNDKGIRLEGPRADVAHMAFKTDVRGFLVFHALFPFRLGRCCCQEQLPSRELSRGWQGGVQRQIASR